MKKQSKISDIYKEVKPPQKRTPNVRKYASQVMNNLTRTKKI